MQEKLLSDEVIERIEDAQAHFPYITVRVATTVLMGWPENEIAFMSDLDSVEIQLQDCEKSVQPEEDVEEEIPEGPSPEELLENCSQYGKNLLNILDILRSIIHNAPDVIRMLILGETEKLSEQIAGAQEDSILKEDAMEILRSSDLNKELTLFGAAERVYKAAGNYERIAEKLYILSLPIFEEDAVHALLSLYSEANNVDLFLKTVASFGSDYALTMKEQNDYIALLGVRNPSAALAYVHDHYSLMYQRDCMDTILSLPEDVLSGQERQMLEIRKSRFEHIDQMNELETAIAENDIEAIQTLISEQDRLSEMGYSAEEIRRISAVFVERETMETSDNDQNENYKLGMRFFRYQKNKNSVAEYYMWKGISQKPDTIALGLMIILAEEERWEEVCRLYESSRMLYAGNMNCRKLYLYSLLRRNPADAINYIQTNLQECLAFMNDSSMAFMRVTVEALRNCEDEAVASYYRKICELNGYLADELVKSIVCLERSLRETADYTYAIHAGVDEKFARTITNVYKSDSYSHGMDAFSIASRLYEMTGTYRGAAEAFAKFASADVKSARLLWEIYSEDEDEDALLELMYSYPVLKEEKAERFLDILFKKEKYYDFVNECEGKDKSWERKMQLFIAELSVVPDASRIEMPQDEEPENSETVQKWFKNWGALLVTRLYDSERTQDLQQLLLHRFEGLLGKLDEDTLKRIVTGNGMVDEKALLSIQEEAVKEDKLTLALYLYHILKIGSLQELSENYYREKIEELDALEADARLYGLKELQLIYGDTNKAIDGEIASLEIIDTLKNVEEDPEAKAKTVVATLEKAEWDEESTKNIFTVLASTELLGAEPVYSKLIQMANTKELKLQLFSMFEKAEDQIQLFKNADFREEVYSWYIDLFEAGMFPEETIERVHDRICQNMQNQYSVEALLLLYNLEAKAEETDRAEYVLRLLAEASLDEMEDKIKDKVKVILSETWGFIIPSYLELFKKVLNEKNLNEISEYLVFVNLITRKDLFWNVEFVHENTEDRMLSEKESDDLVKRLFCNKDNAVIWKSAMSLPLRDNPVAYAKLWYMNSRLNFDAYESCVKHCEKYEQNDLLIDALLNWAESDTQLHGSACRKHLETIITENPDFLLKWNGNPKLSRLVTAISEPFDAADTDKGHTILRTVQLIAEKCQDRDILRNFVDTYRKNLFDTNCNLGLVLVGNLLLDARYEEASENLLQLKNVLAPMNYRTLVSLLGGMTSEELENWTQEAGNRLMLQLVLPDGNLPSAERINDLIDEGIVNGQVPETIHVMEYLISITEEDYAAYNALFDLCCTDPVNYIPQLHKALRGLVWISPSAKNRGYYRRTQLDYAMMLATMDALCIANHWLDRIEGYDFSKRTGEYYLEKVGAYGNNYESVAKVNEKREKVEVSLRNRTERQFELMTMAYLGAITGNWKGMLEQAWAKKEDISLELSLDVESTVRSGFIRSLMRMLLENDESDRKQILQWIKNNKNIRLERLHEIEFVEQFYKENWFSLWEHNLGIEEPAKMLQHPFEDCCLYRKWEAKYLNGLEKINADPNLLYAVIWLVSAMVKDAYFQGLLFRRAEKYFKERKDSYANVLYKTLFWIGKGSTLNIQHEQIDLHSREKRKNDQIIKEKREIYQCMYRITALFCNDQEVKADVKKIDFHTWSCINMVLKLLTSTRGNEVRRLSLYFADKNRILAEDLLKAFDPRISDADKVKLIDNRKDLVETVYFVYAVKYPAYTRSASGINMNSYALKTAQGKQIYNDKYLEGMNELAKERNEAVTQQRRMAHLLLTVDHSLPEYAFYQKDPMRWEEKSEEIKAETPEENLSSTEPFVPEYAKDITPLLYDGNIDRIIQEHADKGNLAADIEEKRALSRIIYQHKLADKGDIEKSIDSMLMYGSDCYYYALTEGDKETANKILMDMAKVLYQQPDKAEGYSEAKNTLQNGLQKTLLSFDGLQALLAFYGENRE